MRTLRGSVHILFFACGCFAALFTPPFRMRTLRAPVHTPFSHAAALRLCSPPLFRMRTLRGHVYTFFFACGLCTPCPHLLFSPKKAPGSIAKKKKTILVSPGEGIRNQKKSWTNFREKIRFIFPPQKFTGTPRWILTSKKFLIVAHKSSSIHVSLWFCQAPLLSKKKEKERKIIKNVRKGNPLLPSFLLDFVFFNWRSSYAFFSFW